MPRGMAGGIRLLFVVVAFAAMAVASARAFVPPTAEELAAVVPGAVSSEHELRPFDFYRMTDAGGHVVGAAFVTSHVPPVVSGYRGEIDVLVGIDTGGRITGLKLLGHNETPQLFQRVIDADLFRRFVGRKSGDDFGDIEAITGATISSQAIIEDVRSSAEAIAKQITGAGAIVAGASIAARLMPWEGGAAALLLVVGAIAATLLPRRRRLRAALLVASVATVGIWFNMPVTIGDLVDLRNVVLPSSMHLGLLVLLVFAVAAPFIRGNLYCAYVCPFGALQEGAAEIGLPKCRPSASADAAASWLRWVILLAAIWGIAVEGNEAIRTVEPFALCFSRSSVVPALVQTGVVLLAALFVRRIWCRFFCPTGLVLDLFALLGSKIRRALSMLRRRRHDFSAHP